ncbi:MAG: MFS transporter [Hyphomicrobium sp.]
MRAVWALGITELIAWGTTFYVLGVLGRPISADTGWSQSFVFAGMTAGLVASGLISTWIGRLVDRHGGRIVMTIGLMLAAAGHLVIAAAWTEWVYIAGWLLLGPAMRMVLYDAAFAAIVQVLPSRGRRAISYLTLFGGLASTVFWPVGHWLDGVVGWRATLVVFAALCLLVAAPLTWWGLARREEQADDVTEPGDGRMMDADLTGHPDRAHPPLEGGVRLAAVVLFGLVLAANAFVFGALSVHLVSVLQGSGLALGAAVGLASLKGVAQVAGRAWELYFGQGLAAVALGRLAIVLLPASLAVLIFTGTSYETAVLFTLLLGVSNGLVTIVRGAVPLALFGAEGYGTMLGMLAAPQLLMNALAPFAFAAIVEEFGLRAGLWVLLAAAALSWVAMELTAYWVAHARRPRA